MMQKEMPIISHYLPVECSQSRLSGANGINACVIISLLINYFMMNTPNLFVDVIC